MKFFRAGMLAATVLISAFAVAQAPKSFQDGNGAIHWLTTLAGAEGNTDNSPLYPAPVTSGFDFGSSGSTIR